MSAAADIRQPARCRILVGEQELSDLYPMLVDVRVEASRAAAAVCTLTFDTIRVDDATWSIQDSGVFEPWKSFRLDAIFGDYDEEIMRGYVRSINADTPEQMGQSKVTIVCQDETLVLDREHLRRAWSSEEEPRSDGDILRDLASQYGFEAETEDGLTNRSLNQDSTAIRFLRQRAEANGYELYAREGKLFMHPPQLDAEPQPPIRVHAGGATNCTGFSVTHDGHRPDQVGFVRAADTGIEPERETLSPDLALLGRQAASSTGTALAPFTWQMQRPAGATLEEARSRAQARANENAWKIQAAGVIDGSLYGHVLHTHKLVGVYGVGETYSGRYYVDTVSHLFSQTGYRQSFRLLRNATGQDSEPAGSDALAAVR